VSVIVPFRDGFAALTRCLEALQRQSVGAAALEVVAVDNNSRGDTAELKRKFPTVHWRHEARPGSYAARNEGLRHATRPIIAFTDSDCVPAPTWIENGLAELARSKAAILGGKVQLIDVRDRPLNAYEIFEENFFGLADQKRLVEQRGFAATANVITYRATFDRAGPFDATLKSSGDKEWVQRAVAAGATLAYADSAVVFHPRRSTFTEIAKKTRRIVGGQIVLLKKQGAPRRDVWANFYRHSMLNPHVHAFAFCFPKVPPGLTRLRFAALVETLSVIASAEKCRVLLGGAAFRG
jgi:glycosyltransferase involved in cell wall biosynthesis